MENPKPSSRAIFGMTLNIICAAVLIYLMVDYHEKWATPPVVIPPDTRLSTDETLLHIVNYWVFPFLAAAMLLSTFWFWKLRK
jgi:hypothetical protein